jgi:surfactin synthase thioesterase subunit
VPFAGGGAAVWHPWAAPLAGLAEIVGLRLPGRESRFAEPPLTALLAMVSALVDIIAPFAIEDYALCGHSLGGLIAFELSRALQARGLQPPVALIVSGVRAPHHPPDEPLVHRLPPDAFIAEVERRYGAIPPEIRETPEIMELLLPALRADLAAYETYRHTPSPPLELPLLALGGANDANVSPAQLLDWRACTTQRFATETLPGGHFFLQEHRDPTVARVRSFLQECLAARPR